MRCGEVMVTVSGVLLEMMKVKGKEMSCKDD